MSLIDVFRAQYRTLPMCLQPSDCADKTYIVTGSNIGIGLETAKHLARLGAARVVMAVRSPSRGAAALAELEAETGKRGVAELWALDLSSYASIKEFAGKVASDLDKVDGLVQNAAGANAEWIECEGLESTVTVNVVGTMLLTILLMPYMERTARKYSIRPVIEIVSSTLGFARKDDLPKIGRGNILRDLSDEKKWSTDGVNRYALSKLLQIMATRRLAALAPPARTGVVVNYVSPGLCNTGLARNASPSTKLSVGALRIAMGRSAEWGSRNVLHGLSVGEESHGKLLTYCEIKEDWIPDWITNRDGDDWCKRVWEDIAAELERVQPGCVGAALEQPRSS